MHDLIGGLLLVGSQEPTQPLILSPPSPPMALHDGEKVGARKLMGHDEDSEITHILLSQAKQTQLEEFDFIYYQLT